MKLEVDHEKCIGCGACIEIDSENLDYDESGYAIAINQNITEQTKDAEKCCPVGAIHIIEEKNNR